MKNSQRMVDVVGVAERVGQVTGVVAAVTAQAISGGEIKQTGAHVLGEVSLSNSSLLTKIIAAGTNLHSFVRA